MPRPTRSTLFAILVLSPLLAAPSKPRGKSAPPAAPAAPAAPGRETLLEEAAPKCDNAQTLVETPGVIGGPALLILQGNEETKWKYAADLQPSPRETVLASAVKTIVCVKETLKKEDKKYNDGAEAFRRVWDVRLLKWPEGTLVRQREINVGAPVLKSGKGPGIGAQPVAMTALFLDSPSVTSHLSFKAKYRQYSLAPERGLLAANADGKAVTLLDLGGAAARTIDPALQKFFGAGQLALSPDGKVLALAVPERKQQYQSRTGCLSFWNVDTGKEQGSGKTCHDDTISDLTFSRDGSLLASITGKKIKIWDTTTAKEVSMLDSLGGKFSSVAFAKDNGTLAVSCNWGKGLALWNAKSGLSGQPLQNESTYAAAFSPDGSMLASGHGGARKSEGVGFEGVVHLWELASSKKVRALPHDGEAVSLAYAPDGKLLAVGTTAPEIALWDVVHGQRLAILTGHVDSPRILMFSSDGKKLYSVAETGKEGGELKVWDLTAALGASRP